MQIHPVLLGVMGAVFYAINGAMVERLLKGNHPLWNQIISNALVPVWCVICMAVVRHVNGPIALKTDVPHVFAFAVACSLILFLGHSAFYYALQNGGSITSVSSAIALLPIMSTLISLCLGGKWPSWNEIGGMSLVVAGICLFLRK